MLKTPLSCSYVSHGRRSSPTWHSRTRRPTTCSGAARGRSSSTSARSSAGAYGRAVARLPPVLHALPVPATRRRRTRASRSSPGFADVSKDPPSEARALLRGGTPSRRRPATRRATRQARAQPRGPLEGCTARATRGRLRQAPHRGQSEGAREARHTSRSAARLHGVERVRRDVQLLRRRHPREGGVRSCRSPPATADTRVGPGGNDGRYSRIASEGSAYTIALDADRGVVESLYRALQQEGVHDHLPSIGDVADPSPGLGWRGHERLTLLERGRPDLDPRPRPRSPPGDWAHDSDAEVVEWLADVGGELIVEFPDREDVMVGRLPGAEARGFASRDTRSAFEECSARFDISTSIELPSGTRTLYHATPS